MIDLKLYTEFKESMFAIVKGMIVDNGGLPPIGAALVFDADADKYGIAFIPIPGEFLKDESRKEVLANIVFPDAFKQIETEHNHRIVGFCWSTEVWIRSTNKNALPDNYQELPKEEGVILNMETEEQSDIIIKLVKREGKVINKEGNLIDNILLEDYHTEFSGVIHPGVSPTSSEGRFANIFKNYRKVNP